MTDTGEPPPGSVLHHMLIDEYIDERLGNEELALTSAEAIRWTLRKWSAFVGYSAPEMWTRDDVQRWLHPGLRPATRKSYRTRLNPYMHWLSGRSLMDANQIPTAPKARLTEGSPRDLTTDEVGRLLTACPDERATLIVLLMVHMGLRCGDVARICVEDIDTSRRLLHVRAKGGRGEHTHWDPIPTEAWWAVSTWLERTRLASGCGPLLFTTVGVERRPMDAHYISKLVGRWMRSAGLKRQPYDGVSAHALRHTCAQHMIDAGADLRLVQWGLGHKTIRSTEIYVRREPPDLREAMDGRSYLPGAAG